MKNIDKSKLVLRQVNEDRIQDQPLETKEIGYYQDSWNRFKKNKASFVAFIIICFVLFFVVFGPHMKKYDLPKTQRDKSQMIDHLTPKIPLIEKLGIFAGHKNISIGRRLAVAIANHPMGKDIIISGLPSDLQNLSDEALDDFIYGKNYGEYENITTFNLKVDYYKYKNFVRSYIPVDYF